MKSHVWRFAFLAPVFVCTVAQSAKAQKVREPEGGPLPPYAKVLVPREGQDLDAQALEPVTEYFNIMVTGYWPPSNEMLRPFSTNLVQNPDGWVGQNWEGRGYNIYSFFPEFPAGLGKGEGDFEVDYQDTSADWWRIVDEVKPMAIITFGRAGPDFDWELEGGHHMYPLPDWADDYLEPYDPTPDLPIADEPPGSERWSTLPIDAIVEAVNDAVPALYAYGTVIDDSDFLCNFIGYHATWYHDTYADPADPLWNIASGHIHVGSHMELEDAILATEVTLRTLIDHLDTQLPARGDFDDDGDIDGDDYTAFGLCYTGPDGGPVELECRTGDFDADGDVDCDDWYLFVLAWTEPGEPPVLTECPIVCPLMAPSPHDTPKNRYISFEPRNDGYSVAFHVELTASGQFPGSAGVTGWVGESDENGISRLVDEPFFSDVWPAVVHLGDCEIVPVAEYEIRATADGSVLTDPLMLATIPEPTPKKWGDVVGQFLGAAWSAPNGTVNFDDVVAAVKVFEGEETAPHVTWVDVHDEVPNKVLNFTDIFQIVLAFQGDDYPFNAPADCP